MGDEGSDDDIEVSDISASEISLSSSVFPTPNPLFIKTQCCCSLANCVCLRGAYIEIAGGQISIAEADLEYGESSMGVTLMREEGESKDWERWMRTFGEGVRGGGAKVVISMDRCVMLIVWVNLGWER